MGDKWREMRFEDAIDINPPRKILRGEIAPHVSMDAVQPFTRMINHFEMKEFKGSGSRFKNGDTLMARITPCLENGKTVFISCLPDDVVGQGSTEFIVLSGKVGVSDNLFVYYLARDPGFRNYAIQHMEGSTGRQRVPASAIAKLKIKLPPLPEQKSYRLNTRCAG
jgi:type I restriction enzyme S subunit